MKVKPLKARLDNAGNAAKLGDESLTLMDLDSDHIINVLEDKIRIRETPIAAQLKKRLLK